MVAMVMGVVCMHDGTVGMMMVVPVVMAMVIAMVVTMVVMMRHRTPKLGHTLPEPPKKCKSARWIVCGLFFLQKKNPVKDKH